MSRSAWRWMPRVSAASVWVIPVKEVKDGGVAILRLHARERPLEEFTTLALLYEVRIGSIRCPGRPVGSDTAT